MGTLTDWELSAASIRKFVDASRECAAKKIRNLPGGLTGEAAAECLITWHTAFKMATRHDPYGYRSPDPGAGETEPQKLTAEERRWRFMAAVKAEAGLNETARIIKGEAGLSETARTFPKFSDSERTVAEDVLEECDLTFAQKDKGNTPLYFYRHCAEGIAHPETMKWLVPVSDDDGTLTSKTRAGAVREITAALNPGNAQKDHAPAEVSHAVRSHTVIIVAAPLRAYAAA